MKTKKSTRTAIPIDIYETKFGIVKVFETQARHLQIIVEPVDRGKYPFHKDRIHYFSDTFHIILEFYAAHGYDVKEILIPPEFRKHWIK